jgi:16S rRNA (uracil1498-N3)-methyltransferase
MLVAMPNKREKAELIVQKLCEIGVDTIIFRPSERSVVKVWNPNKEERLLKISKEAVEQSRGWKLPTVTFMSDIHERLQNNKLIVFDKGGNVETLKS